MPERPLPQDPVAATVAANPGCTTEELATLFGCDPPAADEYLYRMAQHRVLELERDEERRWWYRPGGARWPAYDGDPEFLRAQPADATPLANLGALANLGTLVDEAPTPADQRWDFDTVRGARWQWRVYAMCAEGGGGDAGGTFTAPVPLPRSAAKLELAAAQEHGWWIVKRVVDRPPYTHHIAVRARGGLGIWHFLVQLERPVCRPINRRPTTGETHGMTATPPVRVRVTRHPADPAADLTLTVGRTYQADVDEDGRAVIAEGPGAGARLEPGEYEVTRWWFRNSRDPGHQGDGWRWSLSLRLPGIRLPRWVRLHRPTIAEATAAQQARQELGAEPPWTLALLPLTGEQRAAVWTEWLAAQHELACSMGAHVWSDPESAARSLRDRQVGDQDDCRHCPVVRVVIDPGDGRGPHYVFRSTDPAGRAYR